MNWPVAKVISFLKNLFLTLVAMLISQSENSVNLGRGHQKEYFY